MAGQHRFPNSRTFGILSILPGAFAGLLRSSIPATSEVLRCGSDDEHKRVPCPPVLCTTGMRELLRVDPSTVVRACIRHRCQGVDACTREIGTFPLALLEAGVADFFIMITGYL